MNNKQTNNNVKLVLISFKNKWVKKIVGEIQKERNKQATVFCFCFF